MPKRVIVFFFFSAITTSCELDTVRIRELFIKLSCGDYRVSSERRYWESCLLSGFRVRRVKRSFSTALLASLMDCLGVDTRIEYRGFVNEDESWYKETASPLYSLQRIMRDPRFWPRSAE